MRKNPFSRLINHKILHKIGKQWVVLSASIIFLLTGASLAPNVPVNASQVKPNVTQQRQFKLSKFSTQDKIQTHSISTKQPNHIIDFNDSAQATHNDNIKTIRTRAKHLHQNIIMTAMRVNHKVINPKNGKQVITAHRRYGYKHYRRHMRRHMKIHVRRHRRRYRIRRHRTAGRRYYIDTDRRDNQYGIPYGELGYFQKDNSDEYSNVFSDLGYISKGSKSRILAKARIRGYDFDLVHYPGSLTNKYWLLSNMISTKRNRTYNPSTFTHFITKEDNAFLNSHFDSSDISDIKNIRQEYRYLMKYENRSSTRSTPSFRQHVIDWINFYRQDIFHESPVSEDSSFDEKAQWGADHSKDQEDMNWGDSDPEEIVNSYITDSADEDNDGTTGHRDSVLDPVDSKVGVGQNGDINSLFFHWGWGDTATNSDANIDYPKLSDFPVNLAKDGEYWSIHNSERPSYVSVSIYDKTAGKNIDISHTNLIGKEVYLKINPDQLHTGHDYHISVNFTINGADNPYWYNTQLYELNPYASSNI